MSEDAAHLLVNEGKLTEGSEVHTVINAGHQMLVTNPLETSYFLIKGIFGGECGIDQQKFDAFVQEN